MSDIQIDIPDITVIVDKGDEYLSQIIQPATIVTSATGSLLRYADIATSSSYALTASYALNLDDSAAFPFTGSAEISGSLQVMGGTISGSFVGDGSGLTGLVTDLRISGSTGSDVVSLISDDLTFAGTNGVTTVVTNNTVTIGIPEGTVSSSAQASDWSVASASVAATASYIAAENLPTGLISSSTQVSYPQLQNIPAGIVSSSAQASEWTVASASVATSASYAQNANLLDGKDSTTFATTGSNVFVGNQIISGSLITTADKMTFVGNIEVTGSLSVTNIITGSIVSALTASYIDGGYY
jgi:hypothetical protein